MARLANSLPKTPRNIREVLRKDRHGKRTDNSIWRQLHEKIIQVAGRGGKGHTFSGGNIGWNRKGRW